jgi:prepilin-type N-terminal cleavage/methylation domain-containing protein/uncharacterized repeat protein (TIGR02543 family)
MTFSLTNKHLYGVFFYNMLYYFYRIGGYMKKKNGFTLIELLAVIVILSVLLIISVPKLIGEIKNNKSDALNNYKGMIVSAARNYVIDYNLDEPLTISLTTLCDLDYIECPIVDPTTENNMNGYVNVDSDKNYSYSEDTPLYAATYDINLSLGGGYTTQTIHTGYVEGERIDLVKPIRAGYSFNGWSAGCGDCLSGIVYIVGSSNDTITANWLIYPTLTVNLVGGTTTQTFSARYEPNSKISLTNPKKSGSIFDGWSASGTGASVSGSILTMGTGNTTLTASWLAFANMFTYTGSYEILDDTDSNWRIKFKTNGEFTPLRNMTIDVFLVGGGGGGAGNSGTNGAGGGGGGGYTGTWKNISLIANSGPYSIEIGIGGTRGSGKGTAGTGGTTIAFGYSKAGGLGGSNTGDYTWSANAGGAGGCGGGNSGYYADGPQIYGGTGGSDGSNGVPGGAGQGSTTREFGETGGALYAGGGGGAAERGDSTRGPGGADGGGTGGGSITGATSGTANTGGGGGGGPDYANGASGGSGIVIIRNHR